MEGSHGHGGMMRNRVTDFDALLAAILAVSATHDVDGVLQLITDRARELVGADYAALGVPDVTRDGLDRFFVSGVSDADAERIGGPPMQHGLLGIMLGSLSLRVEHVRQHPQFTGWPPGHPAIDDLLGVPISQGAEALGDLYVAHKTGGGTFDAADEATLEALARHAALALSNARLLARLARSEARYRTLSEQAPDLVFAVGADGRVAYANRRVSDLAGVSADQVIGKPLRDLFVPADRPIVDLNLKALAKGADRIGFAAAVGSDQDRRHLDVSIVRGDETELHGIARDVTSRIRMSEEIADRTHELLATQAERQRLREFVSMVIQAQEDERSRIASDLHDSTVQTLTAIGRRLRSLADEPGRSPAARAAELGQLADAAITEADEVRRLSRNLRPSVLDHLGLDAALSLLVEELRETGVVARLEVTGDSSHLADRTRTALFRIAQEAVTNIRRHSSARQTSVRLDVGAVEVLLEITDDGCGFDAPALESERQRSARLGVAGMRERAVMLGGIVHIRSQPGAGTTVEARLPLDA